MDNVDGFKSKSVGGRWERWIMWIVIKKKLVGGGWIVLRKEQGVGGGKNG